MNTKLTKICEVLISTVLLSLIVLTLFWSYAILRNWHGQVEPGRLLAAFFYGIFIGLITMGFYIVPSALVVAFVIASLKRWSVKAVALLLLSVTMCTSLTAYFIDPTQSESEHGAIGYFTRFEWFASQFNLIGIVTGFVASLITFWALQRCRRRYEVVA